ncbi:28S ribosomal protein S18c, mitochondrial isoform X2 [Stegostoma tigrinum]|uniref:28S ribosomal protein S18c, mitochondrial isoform X2 n=1 Tax=Stegostoma tigrinum TaxID=3053191 RepID=UPI00202B635D|nr:28S ribosomal protein S18c, mitochondrial isoform X2 [Stegostoma tigrinum]
MLRALRKWRPVYWQKRISTQHIPSTSNTSDMPIKLENPYKEPPKKCILCGVPVDYKNVQLLSQFISPYTGRIFGRHITGFMSVTFKDPAFLKDPNICDFKL